MPTRTTLAALLAGAALATSGVAAVQAANEPAYVAAAVADPSRPAADTARDAARLPGQMVVFAGIKPGSKVADLLPGGGYFTRVFAKAVGPKGKVYAFIPAGAMKDRMTTGFQPVIDSKYGNVEAISQDMAAFAPPESLDVVWTAQNYHDLHLRGGSPDALNQAIYKALKPGGVYVIVDHAAAAGATTAPDTLHRIDPAQVKAEVLKAGFKFDGESNALRQPSDDHTKPSRDLHDATDRFAYRFKK